MGQNDDAVENTQLEKHEEISDIPGELTAEEPGSKGRSAVGSPVTTDESVEDMMSATEPGTATEALEASSDVEDVSHRWPTAESAGRVGDDTELSEEYFEELNSELNSALKSPESIGQYVLSREKENIVDDGGMYDFVNGVGARKTGIGMTLSYGPEDQEVIDEQALNTVVEKAGSLASREGPARLMTFARIADAEGSVEQKELYRGEETLAQPTVSLVTDEWEEYGLVEKDDGSVELTEAGEEVYNVVERIGRTDYRE